MSSDPTATWHEAAVDLDIRVEIPYVVALSPTQHLHCIAFLPDFGSRDGTVVRSTTDPDEPRLHDVLTSCVSLSPEVYGSDDRHVWIDLLEDLRWFGSGPPPSWYTVISPWRHDATVRRAVTDELTRIFGEPTPIETTALYRRLDLMPADELLAFLARVPTGGATRLSFVRWVLDVADEWNRAHPRRPSSER